MNFLADLHTHTNYSDGKLSPEELLKKADKVGLSAISITDHDTIDGLKVALSLKSQFKVDILPGIELSCYENGQEVHILGYNFNIYSESLNQNIEDFKKNRFERAIEIIAKLNEAGIEINIEEVLANAGKSPITRPHIANILVEKKYTYDIKQAFMKYLMEGRKAYVPKFDISVKDAINVIKSAGGIAVLAHPGKYISQKQILKMINEGLDGIEVVHPSHDLKHQIQFHNIAKQYWLFETGGSDYHGTRFYDNANFGKFTISYAVVKNIREHKKNEIPENNSDKL